MNENNLLAQVNSVTSTSLLKNSDGKKFPAKSQDHKEATHCKKIKPAGNKC